MELIFEILTLSLFANWITHWFTPFNYFREKITEVWVEYSIRYLHPAFARLAIVLSCPKCFGFWFTLIYKHDFFLALAVSFGSLVIKFIIDKMQDWYEK